VIRGTTTLIAHPGYPTEAFKASMIYNPYFEQAGIDAVVVPMGVKAEDFIVMLYQEVRRSGNKALPATPE
jgi:shikimate dehydrogenase